MSIKVKLFLSAGLLIGIFALSFLNPQKVNAGCSGNYYCGRQECTCTYPGGTCTGLPWCGPSGNYDCICGIAIQSSHACTGNDYGSCVGSTCEQCTAEQECVADVCLWQQTWPPGVPTPTGLPPGGGGGCPTCYSVSIGFTFFIDTNQNGVWENGEQVVRLEDGDGTGSNGLTPITIPGFRFANVSLQRLEAGSVVENYALSTSDLADTCPDTDGGHSHMAQLRTRIDFDERWPTGYTFDTPNFRDRTTSLSATNVACGGGDRADRWRTLTGAWKHAALIDTNYNQSVRFRVTPPAGYRFSGSTDWSQYQTVPMSTHTGQYFIRAIGLIPFAPKSCFVLGPAPNSVFGLTTPIPFQFTGRGYAQPEPVRLWVERTDRAAIVPPPNGTIGTSSFYYQIGVCQTPAGLPFSCTGTANVSNLPGGDYYAHCDLTTNPDRCSGNPFCPPLVGICPAGGIGPPCPACTGWVGCDETTYRDYVHFSVASPTPTPLLSRLNVYFYNSLRCAVPAGQVNSTRQVEVGVTPVLNCTDPVRCYPPNINIPLNAPTPMPPAANFNNMFVNSTGDTQYQAVFDATDLPIEWNACATSRTATFNASNYNQNPFQSVSFPLAQSFPWFQTIGGSAHTQTGNRWTSAAINFFNLPDAGPPAKDAGLVSVQPNVNLSSVCQDSAGACHPAGEPDWIMVNRNITSTQDFNPTTFTDFFNIAGSSLTADTTTTSINLQNLTAGTYLFSGQNMRISNGTVGNKKITIFIRGGSLIVGSNVTIDMNGFLAIFVQGDITVEKQNVQRVDGFYLTDGAFITDDSGINPNPLTVNGTVVATSVANQRMLVSGLDPSLIFKFNPRLIVNMPEYLKHQAVFDWQEVAK